MPQSLDPVSTTLLHLSFFIVTSALDHSAILPLLRGLEIFEYLLNFEKKLELAESK